MMPSMSAAQKRRYLKGLVRQHVLSSKAIDYLRYLARDMGIDFNVALRWTIEAEEEGREG